MTKSEAKKHFRTYSAIASAMTKAGFPISRQAVSQWPDPIPIGHAIVLTKINRRLPLNLERDYMRATGT